MWCCPRFVALDSLLGPEDAVWLQVDGGITVETIAQCADACRCLRRRQLRVRPGRSRQGGRDAAGRRAAGDSSGGLDPPLRGRLAPNRR